MSDGWIYKFWPLLFFSSFLSSLNHPGDRREDGADFRRGLILGFTKILPNITKFPTNYEITTKKIHIKIFIYL